MNYIEVLTSLIIVTCQVNIKNFDQDKTTKCIDYYINCVIIDDTHTTDKIRKKFHECKNYGNDSN